MTDRPRVRRPRLERNNAVRNWATLFGMPLGGGSRLDGEAVWGARDGGNGGGNGDGSGGGNGGGNGRASGTVEDVVARSVGLGYRVIDEYIQQGERVARSLGDRSYGTTTMLNDTQALAVRMAQYATEMTSLWFELTGFAARGAVFPLGAMAGAERRPASPEPTTAASAETARSAATTETRLRVAVQSSRPTEVSVDLRLAGAVLPIAAGVLRSTTPAGVRLRDVAVERLNGDVPLTLRIRVPDDQAPGDYEGTLVDDAGRSVGWITLRVGAA